MRFFLWIVLTEIPFEFCQTKPFVSEEDPFRFARTMRLIEKFLEVFDKKLFQERIFQQKFLILLCLFVN